MVNNGSGPLEVQDLRITGVDADSFYVRCLGYDVIPSGGSLEGVVRFSPTIAKANHQATLEIQTTGGVLTAALQGSYAAAPLRVDPQQFRVRRFF